MKIILAVILALIMIVGGLFIYKSTAESNFQANAPEWLEYDRVSFNPLTGNFDIQEVELEPLKQLLNLREVPTISSIVTNFSRDGQSIYLALEGVTVNVEDIGYGSLLREGDMFKGYLEYLDLEAFTGNLMIKIDRDISDNEAEIEFNLHLDQLADYDYRLNLLKVNSVFRALIKTADVDFNNLVEISYGSRTPTASGLLLASLLEKFLKVKVLDASFNIEDAGYFDHYALNKKKINESIIPEKVDFLSSCIERYIERPFFRMECYLNDGSLQSAEFSISLRKAVKLDEILTGFNRGMSKKQYRKYNLEGDI